MTWMNSSRAMWSLSRTAKGNVRRRPELRVAAAIWFALAAPAAAGERHPTIMQDDALLLRSGPAAREQALDEMAALGADRVRILVEWRDYAASPAPWAAL